jgi:hypothetical protein
LLNYPSSGSTKYRYDSLGRRIAKLSQGKTTLYGWDGDVLAFETQDDAAVHYLFEPGSFIPLAPGAHRRHPGRESAGMEPVRKE